MFNLHTKYQIGSFEIRINWLVATCVAITTATFANLGLWQLDRAAEKVETQRILELELEQNAGAIEDIPIGHIHPANPEMRNRHVQLTGEYVNERTILVLAEFFGDQIGYGVVTPLRLASNNSLVLVHRGWTTGMLPPDMPPLLRPVEGPVKVAGQIFVPPENTRAFASKINASEWPLRVRNLEIDIISEIINEPIFPFEVRLTADQPGALVRHWPAVNPDVNQNLFYAVQWFSFGLLLIFVALLSSSNLWQLLKGPERE